MNSKLLDIILVLFSAQIVKTYPDCWGRYKKQSSIIHYIVWGIYLFFQYYMRRSAIRYPIVMLFINILIIFMIYKTKYIYDNKLAIFDAGMLCVIWMILEAATEYFLEKTKMAEADNWLVVGSIISMIIMHILIHFLKYHRKGDFAPFISFGYWIRIISIPITTIYILHNILFSINCGQDDIFFVVTVIMLIIVNIVIIDVYNELGKQIEIERKNLIYAHEITLCNKQAVEREAAYEETKAIRHDINGYLLDLKSVLLLGKTNEALKKIDNILTYNQIYKNEISHSGNLAIDSLINYKYSLALKNKIKIESYVFVPEQLSIDGADLCIILNNILDNAIEGVRELPEVQRKIELSVSIVKGNLSIVIKNPYSGEFRTDSSGNIITSKSDYQNHGIGLASVRRIVEKYEGEFLVKFEAGTFVVRILLYL